MPERVTVRVEGIWVETEFAVPAGLAIASGRPGVGACRDDFALTDIAMGVEYGLRDWYEAATFGACALFGNDSEVDVVAL
jgi:hypothetical protein